MLVQWCEAGEVDLRLPAFAFPEMRAALRRREDERRDVIRSLKRQQSDARRHSADPSPYAVAESELQTWTEREGAQLELVTQTLRRIATFLPLDADTLDTVYILRYHRVIPGDADLFILGSVIEDLSRRELQGDKSRSMFISGDRDFLAAGDWLTMYSCELLTSYSAAVARLKGLR